MAQDNAVHILSVLGTPTLFDIHGNSLGAVGGGINSLAVAQIAFTAAQLISMSDGRKLTAIEPPGDGKVTIVQPFYGIASYVAGATPFTLTGGTKEILLLYEGQDQNPGSGAAGDLLWLSTSGVLDQSVDTMRSVAPDGNFGSFWTLTPDEVVNKAIQVQLYTGHTIADGDGSLTLYLPHITVTL